MSPREKLLVSLFGLAAFVLINAFGISWFKSRKIEVGSRLIAAQGEVEKATDYEAEFDSKFSEMEWVTEQMPEPRTGQIVATELEQYASNQAQTHQLEVKRRSLSKNDETGAYFHRAKVEFSVSGKEDSLYRWLDRLYMPDQFRAVTFLRLSPDAKDDTLIDCTVHVEQWYVPLNSDAATEEVEAPAPQAPVPGLPPGLPLPPQVVPTPANP